MARRERRITLEQVQDFIANAPTTMREHPDSAETEWMRHVELDQAAARHAAHRREQLDVIDIVASFDNHVRDQLDVIAISARFEMQAAIAGEGTVTEQLEAPIDTEERARTVKRAEPEAAAGERMSRETSMRVTQARRLREPDRRPPDEPVDKPYT